ncbi:hypothetical protein MG290_09780 [Flavobacterium sp. CBA20B-1]|uniref:DUF2683 family protein n=1 Tax=unclassified Flavobacterium TaxID=196869 RepID=UPI0022240E53|nr:MULTISPECIES: DUF2683 family protein [unclassified Flavobacterium]WCM41246.1 hypothetical protein MG290_09780 [Flavobacterium sp. CBA20B-1]
MTTITIKINEPTKVGKAFKNLIEFFSKEHKGIEIVSDTKSEYNPAFVEKIKEAENDIKNGKTTRLDAENI